eukprot:scaffold13345_cov209-Alexandrium_tamarense.AAC.8
MPALMYAVKVAAKPFSLVKGPDVLELDVTTTSNRLDGEVTATALVRNRLRVNIKDYSDYITGEQDIGKVQLYVDVHPYDYKNSVEVYEMQPSDDAFDSQEESVKWMVMDTLDLWSVFVEVGDDDGEMLSEKTMSLVADRDWNA